MYDTLLNSSCYFFQIPRWGVFILKACFLRKRMKAPIEQNSRCIFIELKSPAKFFSALSVIIRIKIIIIMQQSVFFKFVNMLVAS